MEELKGIIEEIKGLIAKAESCMSGEEDGEMEDSGESLDYRSSGEKNQSREMRLKAKAALIKNKMKNKKASED